LYVIGHHNFDSKFYKVFYFNRLTGKCRSGSPMVHPSMLSMEFSWPKLPANPRPLCDYPAMNRLAISIASALCGLALTAGAAEPARAAEVIADDLAAR
jgi:hypothetical protein